MKLPRPSASLTVSSPHHSLTHPTHTLRHATERAYTTTMLSEQLFSSICGPPLAANTAVSKDVGVYGHSVTPSWAVKATFKKSSAPPHSLAVNDTHVFAAQDQKAHVHVYSRLRGTQEALVPFQERIRCLALAGDVLVMGTAEGRLILWEVSCFCFFHASSRVNATLTT